MKIPLNGGMKAAVLDRGKYQVEIRDVEDPIPSEDQVKVKIDSCGICGSDLHLIRHGTLQCRHYPAIPGHEASGEVLDIGSNITKFKKGDRVVISAGTSCGSCEYCVSGRENFCRQLGVFGFDRNGSFAEYNIVEERYLYKLPDSIPYDVGAILADAVSTPYHAVRYRAGIRDSDVVAIVGCGGLGIHGVALARIFTKNLLVAVDLDEGALENASYYGADRVLNLQKGKNIGKELKFLTGGVDVLIDFSGHSANIEESLRAMNPGGRIVLVGIGRNPLQFKIPLVLIEKMISILGSYGSDRRAIPELIELVESGRLNLRRSITSHHRLEDLNECLERLEKRVGNPIRFIIRPNSS